MGRAILFTVVTEASTREVTGVFSLERSVHAFLRELGRSFPDGCYEVLVAADHRPSFELSSKKVRWVTAPNAGYFGLKDAGFKAARGRYVAFWDSDCRPAKGYATRAIRRLEADPKLLGVAGASFYMGRSFFGRLEGILSYGPLHLEGGPMTRHSPLAHNLVLRKKGFPTPPFGGFNERIGGDMYVARYAVKLGSPLWVDPKLHMHHERQDIFSKPAKGLEKRTMDLIYPMLHRSVGTPWGALPFALRAALAGFCKKTVKLFRYHRSMSFKWWEVLAGFPVLGFVLVVDLALILAMVLWPPFLIKLLRYQCGEKWDRINLAMKRVTPERFQVGSASIFARETWPTRQDS